MKHFIGVLSLCLTLFGGINEVHCRCRGRIRTSFDPSTNKPYEPPYNPQGNDREGTKEPANPVEETKPPGPKTDAPGPQTDAPGPQTDAPGPKTDAPGPQTDAPGPQTAPPGPQTAPPGPQTAPPGPQTDAPGPQTVAPGPQTDAPGPKTDKPRPSSAATDAPAPSTGSPYDGNKNEKTVPPPKDNDDCEKHWRLSPEEKEAKCKGKIKDDEGGDEDWFLKYKKKKKAVEKDADDDLQKISKDLKDKSRQKKLKLDDGDFDVFEKKCKAYGTWVNNLKKSVVEITEEREDLFKPDAAEKWLKKINGNDGGIDSACKGQVEKSRKDIDAEFQKITSKGEPGDDDYSKAEKFIDDKVKEFSDWWKKESDKGDDTFKEDGDVVYQKKVKKPKAPAPTQVPTEAAAPEKTPEPSTEGSSGNINKNIKTKKPY